MNPRERLLMIVTVIAISGYLAWEFLGVSKAFDSLGASGSQVQLLESEFQEKLRRISKAPEIYAEFNRLVGDDATDEEGIGGNQRPDLRFQQDVARYCDLTGFPRPDIVKKIEDIDGVEEYQLVIVTINIREGDFKNLTELLKLLESKNLILQEVELRSSQDRDIMSARITVARLTEYFFETRGRRARAAIRRG